MFHDLTLYVFVECCGTLSSCVAVKRTLSSSKRWTVVTTRSRSVTSAHVTCGECQNVPSSTPISAGPFAQLLSTDSFDTFSANLQHCPQNLDPRQPLSSLKRRRAPKDTAVCRTGKSTFTFRLQTLYHPKRIGQCHSTFPP